MRMGCLSQSRSSQYILRSVRVRGDALGGFGAVVFFDELQVDIDGGVIAVIEFATVDAEELEGLVEIGFGELGELGEVDSWDVAMP